MKQILIAKLTLAAVVAAAAVVVPSVSARAHEDRVPHAHSQVTTQQGAPVDAQAAREEAKTRVEAKKAEITAKLDEKRKEVCERRQEKINAITDRSVVQAKKHLGVFQKIEERVKAFYDKKGLNAEGYEAAAADADAKEAAAVAAIASTEAVELDCSAEGDQRQIGTYMKNLVRSQHAALKDYRTAIKNLIVVVAQAQKQAEAADEKTTEQADGSTEGSAGTNGRQEGTRQ